ncbi:dolichol kinase [Wyeomyia smithii]|uniref:dolichol kinase n=1 Tax=Wyeomyia smithii TaxID=174621 RepID=UPI002467F8C5|nr:dolichol kinase [Wyeomyia smithii]
MDKAVRRKCIVARCRSNGILVRPDADNGFWLSLLLTFALLLNVVNRDRQPISLIYKRTTILCSGMFLQSTCIFVSFCTKEPVRGSGKVLYTTLTTCITSFLFWMTLNENVIFSSLSGFFSCVLYDRILFYILIKMPKSFTLGEASLVCQGLVAFLYTAFIQIPETFIYDKLKYNTAGQMQLIVQISLLASSLVIILCHFLPILRNTICFWILFLLVASGTALLPIAGYPVFFKLFEFIFSDLKRITTVMIYLLLLIITSIFVIWQLHRDCTANTMLRKIFHFLVLFVYLPGLWYQCTLLYVASAFMLALLLLLETARIIELRPIHGILEQVVKSFVDEKDAGSVALTPIYLLAGCSLPLWLHPAPCDLTDSAGHDFLKMMAGILSVGIGDTLASVCGYYLGKHKWNGSNKSVEGTLASTMGQIVVVFIIHEMGIIQLNTLKAATAGCAIITNALIEAKTNQVDNLILPLVTYIVLCTV